MATAPPNKETSPQATARQARAVFVEQALLRLAELADSIGTRLNTLFEQSTNARESQDRRDAMLVYQQQRSHWLQKTEKAWKQASQFNPDSTSAKLNIMSLELIGNEVMEGKILSSRVAMRISEKAGTEWSDLQIRIKHLQERDDIESTDILRPEALCQHLIEQWLAVELTQDAWISVQDVMQSNFADKMGSAYKAVNEFLISQGVMKTIDLRANLRRTAPGIGRGGAAGVAGQSADSDANTASQPLSGGGLGAGGGGGAAGYASGVDASQGRGGFSGNMTGGFAAVSPGHGSMADYAGSAAVPTGQAAPGARRGTVNTQITEHVAKLRAQAAEFAAAQASGGAVVQNGQIMTAAQAAQANAAAAQAAFNAAQQVQAAAAGIPANSQNPVSMRPGRAAMAQFAQEEAYETRMQTSATPLARARMRAQGVMGQLKRMLTDHVGGFDSTGVPQISPRLAAAFAPAAAAAAPGVRTPGFQRTQQGAAAGASLQGMAAAAGTATGAARAAAPQVYAGVQVQIVEGMQPAQVNDALREQTKEIKKAADTDGEKATIEIVALMFQSILAEERIPSGVRVWFARLQMPVLRLALAEPEFFNSLQHPARRLIDRMGSCVLGFDASVGSAELETEIKRVVQTIEQYPETGRRVFQLVYDEFDKFLGKFLTGSKATQKVVSVAQQVEQKETAAIQFTIELRKMLGNLPMRDEIRDFLFKVWAEVLAIAAMKNGPQHADTLVLKQVAADLLWAASAKPSRAERAKVIADLPALLKKLRSGMGLLGLEQEVQTAQIKLLSDTLADAFMSKTASIDQSQVAEIASRIRNLEDYVSEEDVGDLPLDAESIEITLGIDMSGVDIISKGGSDPNEAMRAWASELEEGAWFHLDHNGKATRVQYSWKSKRGQLHLFADSQGKTFLFQLRRLASYLQAGLLAPVEDETLTVRATRAALTKLDANPERLLAVN